MLGAKGAQAPRGVDTRLSSPSLSMSTGSAICLRPTRWRNVEAVRAVEEEGVVVVVTPVVTMVPVIPRLVSIKGIA